MVTIVLKGGTGNQLYQRAFGYALEALGNQVQFDRSQLDADCSRAYTLDHWNTEVPFGPRSGEFRHEFYRQSLNEGDLYYKPEFLKNYPEDITLDGYWQSYKYWTPEVQETIRKAFTLRRYPSEKSLAVANQIMHSNSVFLHVRRTDNLSARGLAFHGLGSVAYWTTAVQEIHHRVPDAKFFIFSDDIAWCKQQEFFSGAVFVDHNSTGVDVNPEYVLHKKDDGTEHEDLWLMSKCKHGIMATSTFSGWAAWLGPHQTGGVVIRPQQWFIGDYNAQSRDMFPDEYIAR